MSVILRYDGKYDWMPGDSRQWTIRSHFIDAQGQDRMNGSFHLRSLVDFGIVPQIGKVKSQPEAA